MTLTLEQAAMAAEDSWRAQVRRRCEFGLEVSCRECRYGLAGPQGWRGADGGCALRVAAEGGLTLETIGELLGVTRERVRQIQAKAMVEFARAWLRMHPGTPMPPLAAFHRYASEVDRRAARVQQGRGDAATGRVLSTLREHGKCTVRELVALAGMGQRHTSATLHVLELAGLVTGTQSAQSCGERWSRAKQWRIAERESA